MTDSRHPLFRRPRLRTLAIVAVAAMVALPTAAPSFADTTVTSDQFSLGLAPEVVGTPGVPAGYIRLWDMAVAWRDVNPAPGVFDWSVLDQRITQVESAGGKVLYVAGLTPVWAAANPADGDPRWGAGSASAPADPATYSAYISALLARYGGRIAAIESWNEANLKTFWTGTPEQMADLTQRADKAVTDAGLATTVLAASTTTRLLNSVKTFFGPYAAAIKGLGYPIDAWSIHTYPAGTAGPAERYASISAWKVVLSDSTGGDAVAKAKAVWDTEINYGLAGPGATPHTDFDPATSGAYVARTFVDSIRQGIAATFWYLWTAGPYSLLGVQMHTGTSATIDPYNRVRGWTAGATFKGCDDATSVVTCYFVKGEPFMITMSKSGGATPWDGGPGLSGEQWDGTVVNPIGALSLGYGPVKVICGTDTTLCTQRAGSSGSSSAPASTSILLEAEPVMVKGKSVILATGQVTNPQPKQKVVVNLTNSLGKVKRKSVKVDARGGFEVLIPNPPSRAGSGRVSLVAEVFRTAVRSNTVAIQESSRWPGGPAPAGARIQVTAGKTTIGKKIYASVTGTAPLLAGRELSYCRVATYATGKRTEKCLTARQLSVGHGVDVAPDGTFTWMDPARKASPKVTHSVFFTAPGITSNTVVLKTR